VALSSFRHVVSVSGGKDSTATLLLAISRVPREQIAAIFCDTGNEIPVTHAYLNDLERHLGITIHRLKADFSKEIAAKRRYISGDRRTRREYRVAPVIDKNGQPVPKRDCRGNIVFRTINRNGVLVQEPVQKTRKVGGGHRVRWSNKAKRRALDVLHPSGNPYLDLCLWKGRFPSLMAQFCTVELKRNIAVQFQLDLVDQGYSVISWQGVRRDESLNRRRAKKSERIGPNLWAFRPLVDWTAQQAIDYVRSQGCPLNPLYSQGQTRVGCVCINSNKAGLSALAARYPEEIERIAEWERIVSAASKRGASTFFWGSDSRNNPRAIFADNSIWEKVAWATGDNGTMNLFAESDMDVPVCSSAYGLCE
jgi:3'-phosphoadenosine 5'-phosphosulfate sulfotransferase (PAPS reductase)/FAD synthetase